MARPKTQPKATVPRAHQAAGQDTRAQTLISKTTTKTPIVPQDTPVTPPTTPKNLDLTSPDQIVPRGTISLENEISALERRLEDAERLAVLGTLAAAIAHEFNNLLTPVISYTEMALQRPADQALTRKALERALEGAQKSAKIAEAILNLATAPAVPVAAIPAAISPSQDITSPKSDTQQVGLDQANHQIVPRGTIQQSIQPDAHHPRAKPSSRPGKDRRRDRNDASSTASGGGGVGGVVADSPSNQSELNEQHRSKQLIRLTTPVAPKASISDAIDSALRCIGRDLAKDAIAIHQSVPHGTSAAIEPISLQQILFNLIVNARRAMIPGGGVLTLLNLTSPPNNTDYVRITDKTQTNQELVFVSISDSGAGMTTDRMHELALGDFARISVSSTSASRAAPNSAAPIAAPGSTSTELPSDDIRVASGGAGLGLRLCRRLIEHAHGGFWVRSALGQGTEFLIALPRA